MRTIDIQTAQKAFYNYVEKFPECDERIDHKIQHSIRVSGRSREIANALALRREDRALATVIGLIHDIGRFEQHMKYGTYVDRKSEDHGALGVKLLFDDGLIRQFIKTDRYDNIVKLAVSYHNAFELPDGLSEKEMLHCKIIRDADKLDNLYIKQFELFTVMFGKEEISDQPISEKVLEDFLAFKPIKHTDTITDMDTWVKYIAFHFGLYFDESLEIACNGQFGEKMLKRVKGNKDIFKISSALNTYCEGRLN